MITFTSNKKFLRERKCPYTCFVDFKKTYDSICRQRLTYKVEEFWITGNMVEIFKTMYPTLKVSLLYEGKISQSVSKKYDLNKAMCSVLFSPNFL